MSALRLAANYLMLSLNRHTSIRSMTIAPLPSNAIDSCWCYPRLLEVVSLGEIATYLNISRRRLHRIREIIAAETAKQ